MHVLFSLLVDHASGQTLGEADELSAVVSFLKLMLIESMQRD